MKTQAKKRNRSGERGIRNVDKVQDVDLFVDQYKDEDGRIVRLGKIRLSHEINNSLKTIAHELKISKAGLVRALFVGFIKHYKDSKATGANKHFTPESTIQGWLNDRNEFTQLVRQLVQQNNFIQSNSKSAEVKALATQLSILGQMINLTNKNVI